MIISLFVAFLTLLMPQAHSQSIWTPQANFPGGGRAGAFSFAISGKLYVGNGHNSAGIPVNDLWEYNPPSNAWIQKAAIPGNARAYASSFTIGNYGYVGLGDDGSYADDFWRYDPALNNWTQIASLSGSARVQASGFTIGNYGYIAGGFGQSGYQTTFWQYDPANNAWSQKNGFSTIGRVNAVSFSLNGYGYFGAGWYSNNAHTNFWRYDPSIDTWVQVSPLPGSGRSEAVAFSINSFGYVGAGQDNGNNLLLDFYKYDPFSDNWSLVAPIPSGRIYSTAVSVGSDGFVATGGPDNQYNDELWKFTDTTITTDISEASLLSFSVSSNLATDAITIQPSGTGEYKVTITNLSGQMVSQTQGSGSIRIAREGLPSGMYFAIIHDAEGRESVIRFVFE